MLLKKASVTEFVQTLLGKMIYCFGNGKEFCRFFAEFQDWQIEEYVKAVVDNNPEKCGVQQINGKELAVIHANQMLAEIGEGNVILITTAAFMEIVKQLQGYEQLKETKVYIYSQMMEQQCDSEREQVEIPSCLATRQEITIPKIIHYCWFGGQPIPEQSRRWMESWRKYCPDYEIVEWNESNYDVTKNLYVKQAYEQKKWAFVSDYARLDVVEQYGGVYLDTDVELVRNIDELLRNDVFCGFEQRRFVNFGIGYGAIKHHKIIRELRAEYEEREFVLPDGTLNETACPEYQTAMLKKYGLKLNRQYQVLDGITVLPELVLCGMSPYSFKITEKLENTYAIHHFAASWIGQKYHDEISAKRKFFDEME